MDIKPIRTEEDYEQTLLEIEQLWTAEPGSEGADRLDVLATLVDAYEAKHHPIARQMRSMRSFSGWTSSA